MLEWYEIVLIVLAGVVFIASIVFITIFFTYKHALIDKQKTKQETKELYKLFIDAVGGINNISACNSLSSRLNISIVDSSLLNDNLIKEIQQKNIGIFKTSNKITFVVGEFADQCFNALFAEIVVNNEQRFVVVSDFLH